MCKNEELNIPWNGIFGIENITINYQRIAKNEVFAYSNWNGMEWNKV